jgi:3-deoxy-7-phosphoheptulonate synthase
MLENNFFIRFFANLMGCIFHRPWVSRALPSPKRLKKAFPVNGALLKNIERSRAQIRDILAGRDARLLVIIGPCSIHDPIEALEYAARLKAISDRLSDKLLIVMRVYLEKPRTTIGWRGFIQDPDLAREGKTNILKGLREGRKLLLEINAIGLPVAMEFLDPLLPGYLSDLVSWGAVGARTAESQVHREMASHLDIPMGFKNGTSGNIQIAVDAVYSASHPHCFLGVDPAGKIATIQSQGNPYCHIVLRGSHEAGPNYEKISIDKSVQKLTERGLRPKVMIDCSHGNSDKNHQKQIEVIRNIADRLPHEKAIFGLMIESYLRPGAQRLKPKSQEALGLNALETGLSITDPCIGWEETAEILELLAASKTLSH